MTLFLQHIICLNNQPNQPMNLKSEAGSFVGSDSYEGKGTRKSISGFKHQLN